MKQFLINHLNPSIIQVLKKWHHMSSKFIDTLLNCYGKHALTPINIIRNQRNSNRKLEIGPGVGRINGFETVNVVWGDNVDYVVDASRCLPFPDEVFDTVYASHVLEHIPWYLIYSTLAEWYRIIKSDGYLEVWVPNGLLIARTFVDAEEGVESNIDKDGWYKFNDDKDPCVWANGRIYSYGDGTGDKTNPNWHLTLFSPRFLKKMLNESGFVDVELLDRSQVRGYDHGWINLGMRGRKP